jgi:uncharacterized protein
LKYLLLLLAIVLVYWLIRAQQRKRMRSGTNGEGRRATEDMVRCAHCGLHLPRSESLPAGTDFYCTPEHRRLHQQGK